MMMFLPLCIVIILSLTGLQHLLLLVDAFPIPTYHQLSHSILLREKSCWLQKHHHDTSLSLYPSSSEDDSDNNDAFDLKSLQSRMKQLQENDSKLPIVVLDSMLPRQVLKIEVENEIFQNLIKTLVKEERSPLRFGMIGTATLATVENTNIKQAIPLQNGVEVELMKPPQVVESPDNDKGTALRVKLKGKRRFRIDQNQLKTHPGGWTEANVIFLGNEGATNPNDDEDEYLEEEDDDHDYEKERENPLSLARAIKYATELTSIDNNIVERWIELARTKQAFDGQIDQLLEDLGPIPPPTRPSDRAFWVGALINPLPGLGVAMEIRPQLLMAKTAEERIGTVFNAIEASIAHMDGTKPLF